MFWGLILEPMRRYSQSVGKSFHVSQVALDCKTGDNEPCQVMVCVDGQNFLICTLQKNKLLQAQVDMSFRKGELISFTSNGSCNIHLTGYLDLMDEMYGEEMEDEEDEDEEEEEVVPELVSPKSKKAKRKHETSLEENHSSKKIKKDAKVKGGKESESSDDSSGNDSDTSDEDDYMKLLEANDSDDADDSFKPDGSKDEESDDEEENDSESEEMDAEEEDGDDDDAEEKSSPQKGKEVLSKSAQRRERKKEKKKLEKEQQTGTPQQNGHPEKKKDKVNKENDQKKGDGDKSPGSAQKGKKVLTGNVAIEELKVGDGPPAKPGKMIQVYYEGRLKSNNKMFDNCQKGPGFKFRLGKSEVIRGWDVGVAGMKVGGKRRIVCPPGMAYGNKGSPPLIPPNSTLVFDVELRGIN